MYFIPALLTCFTLILSLHAHLQPGDIDRLTTRSPQPETLNPFNDLYVRAANRPGEPDLAKAIAEAEAEQAHPHNKRPAGILPRAPEPWAEANEISINQQRYGPNKNQPPLNFYAMHTPRSVVSTRDADARTELDALFEMLYAREAAPQLPASQQGSGAKQWQQERHNFGYNGPLNTPAQRAAANAWN
ncbi:hypothetical protein MMC10_001801 [Thelotrema lepadinum]|nr:hypothetical protein [Thelotrema lepadinum]